MSASAMEISGEPSRKWLNAGLWAAQILLGAAFCFFGLMKITAPIAELSKTMKWTADLPEMFVRGIGVIDVLGGVGLVLPALTRILPILTVAAALGCTVLQVLAIGFHASRGEFVVLPLNSVLLPLAVFVLWGRSLKVQIKPR